MRFSHLPPSHLAEKDLSAALLLTIVSSELNTQKADLSSVEEIFIPLHSATPILLSAIAR